MILTRPTMLTVASEYSSSENTTYRRERRHLDDLETGAIDSHSNTDARPDCASHRHSESMAMISFWQ